MSSRTEGTYHLEVAAVIFIIYLFILFYICLFDASKIKNYFLSI